MQRIGVISDTHGLMRPEALAALADSELILHAGDIGTPSVIEALSSIAPVQAIRGNVDHGDWAAPLPYSRSIEIQGLRIHMLHDLNQLDESLTTRGVSAVISGHSHKPAISRRAGVLFFNPGSAGPRRFRLPICVGRLRLDGGSVEAEIVELEL